MPWIVLGTIVLGLLYTAFEQFCARVLKIGLDEDAGLKTLQDRYGQAKVIAKVRTLDPGSQFFSFLHKNLDPKPAKRMEAFIKGDPLQR
jgi:hypothetical protein